MITKLGPSNNPLEGAVGAMPPHSMTPAQIIEGKISTMSTGDSIYVDTQGKVSYQKTEFISHERDILFTLRLGGDGTYTVFPSLPPKNVTHVSSLENPDFSKVGPESALLHSIVLRSGDWISLSESFNFQIPTYHPLHAEMRENNAKKVEASIARCEVGSSIEIGRKERPYIPTCVSRVHVTIDILNKTTDDDGKIDMTVRVWRGQPSKTKISVDTGDGSPQKLTGSRTLNPENRIICGGEIGDIKLPHPAMSTYMDLGPIYEQLKEKFTGQKPLSIADVEKSRDFFKTLIPGADHGDFSIANMSEARSYTSLHEAEQAIKISMLDHFIRAGIKLMIAGQHREAMKHFSNVHPLAALGYSFEQNNMFSLGVITEDAIRDNLDRVASRSWFMRDTKTVYPSVGILNPGVKPRNEAELDLLQKWECELALIYAEEWTHALQHASGGLVSKKSALIKHFPNSGEADVALFFQELGMSLSYHYIKDRYDVRDHAFKLAKGVQTEAEEAEIQELYNNLPIGGVMAVTSNKLAVELGPKLMPIAEIISEDTGLKGPGIEQWRQYAATRLSAGAVFITKTETGAPELQAYGKVKVYVPDHKGIYKKLEGKQALEPGTPFYIQRCLRFSLT